MGFLVIDHFQVRVDAMGLIGKLSAMDAAAENPKDALLEVADLFFTVTEPGYWRAARWVPLRPDSARRKRKRGLPARPLVGGTLERSLTSKGARYQVRRVSKSSVTLGTSHPLAAIHDKGTRGALPARRLIAVSKADRAAYRDVFARATVGGNAGRSPRRSLL